DEVASLREELHVKLLEHNRDRLDQGVRVRAIVEGDTDGAYAGLDLRGQLEADGDFALGVGLKMEGLVARLTVWAVLRAIDFHHYADGAIGNLAAAARPLGLACR